VGLSVPAVVPALIWNCSTMAPAKRNAMKLLSALTQRLSAYLQTARGPVAEDGGTPSLTLSHACLEALSPFHLILDGRGTVVASGASFRQVHGGCPNGADLETVVLERDGAESLALPGARLKTLLGRTLRLELRANPSLEFAAQVIRVASPGRQSSSTKARERWILDLRPILETLEDLEVSGLSLQDLSLLDPMRVSMVTMLMEDSLRQELLLGISGLQR